MSNNLSNNLSAIEIQDLGFTSWMELFEWLKEQALENDKTFTLTWEKEAGTEAEVRPDVTLPTNLVKAKAFQEIYDALPTKKSLGVVEDIIFAEQKVQTDVDTIQTFFKNLPTRTA